MPRGIRGVVGVLLEATLSILSLWKKLQEALGRGVLWLCVQKDDWLARGNPLKPWLPKESFSVAKFLSAEPFPQTFS